MNKTIAIAALTAVSMMSFCSHSDAQSGKSSDPFHSGTPKDKDMTNKMIIGEKLPMGTAVFKNANGKDVTLAATAGTEGLLVIFSCNTCPFVIKNQPVTKSVIAFAQQHHVGVVVINSNEAKRSDDDSYAAMQQYAKAQGYTVPYLVDDNSKLADLFGASHTPEVYLFDKNNQLVYKGAMNDNPSDPSSADVNYVNNAMDALVSGKEISPKITHSLGCSIKRRS